MSEKRHRVAPILFNEYPKLKEQDGLFMNIMKKSCAVLLALLRFCLQVRLLKVKLWCVYRVWIGAGGVSGPVYIHLSSARYCLAQTAPTLFPGWGLN